MSHCLTRCIVISCWLKHICVLTSLSEQIMKLCVLTENSRSQHFAIDSLEGRCRCQHFPCRNAGKLQLSLVLMPTFWALYNSSVGIRLTRFMSCLPVDHLRWDVVRCFQNYNRDVSVDGILINTHFETNKHIVWQPRRAADTSTSWRQSHFCCCTASMEQVRRRSWNCCNRRTPFVVIWKHFCFILSTDTRMWYRPSRSSSWGRNASASVTFLIAAYFILTMDTWCEKIKSKTSKPPSWNFTELYVWGKVPELNGTF